MENKIFGGIFSSASDALSLQGRVRETIPASDYNSSRPHETSSAPAVGALMWGTDWNFSAVH